ncbi:hypothetical protein L484_024892 [Morus notabilis]|uniref:Uncharacterized protein n=1 Tax=Morus notabilis TaxID=981085 RepID=W9QWY3_9ROSA|nr:uncharacterized protein LOC21407613 [Morus notabilis]EXB56349.1 hypothetical protein L484_024892 [Morus notabilis]
MERLNFEALRNLQNSANGLLHSPTIQQALIDHRQEKWVHEVSEASLRMLDVCGVSKDVLLLVKQHLQDLQSTLRRVSIGEFSGVERKIAAYNCYRKKLKKETLKCLNSLKGMKGKSIISDPNKAPVDEYNLMVVVDVLREVRVTNISIVESLLSLIAKPWLDHHKSANKGSINIKINILGSKFKRVSGQSLHDIGDAVELQSANKRLKAVEITIECVGVELECIFRRLIRTRVALLNILTN